MKKKKNYTNIIFNLFTVLMLMGQSFIPSGIALANELNTNNNNTVQSETIINNEEEEEQENLSTSEENLSNDLVSEESESLENEADLETNQPNAPPVLNEQVENNNLIPIMPIVSFGGVTSNGEKITYSYVEANPFLRSTGNSTGSLGKYYGGYMTSTAYITVADGVAWCINPEKPFPMGIEYAEQVYTDKGVYNILYYANEWGWTQPNTNYVDVYVALNVHLGHFADTDNAMKSDVNVAKLLDKANKKDAPYGNFSFDKTSQKATVKNNQQETDWYTPKTDGKNVEYKVPVPNDIVKLVTSDGKTLGKGTHTLKQNVKFKYVAPLTYEGKITFDVETNQRAKSALKFIPYDGYSQELTKLGTVRDPIKVQNLSAEFEKRSGNAIFEKKDTVPHILPNTLYSVTIGNQEPFDKKTDENGQLVFNDILHDTIIKVQEKQVAHEGYILDPTVYEIKIVAGETKRLELVNEIQLGKLKGHKNKEYFDAEQTTETGLPVYYTESAAGITFDIVVNSETITYPNGQAVPNQVEEFVVDTVVTDENGDFISNVDLYIGGQNEYRLVEKDIPENYREPVEIKDPIVIPYGANNETDIMYDLGIINNELRKGTWEFTKKDSLTDLALGGATFLVEGISAHNKDVQFQFTSLPTLQSFVFPEGNYKITEIGYPEFYTQAFGQTETMIVQIKDGQTTVTDWYNERLPKKVGISTKAHTGDGKTNTFVWGEEATFYDDSLLTHENIEEGTRRANVVTLYAVYTDENGNETTESVWKSDFMDYEVSDKEMTETVIAEYDYRKDKKADEKTRWYFAEEGYNYDNGKPTKDTEHNPDGTDPKQDIKSIVKEEPTTPAKTVTNLPKTGETASYLVSLMGTCLLAVVFFFRKIKISL